MGGQISWTVGLVSLAMFAIAIVGFGINFASDNNAAVDIADDSDFSGLYTNTTANLSTFASQAETSSNSILNTTIPPGSQTAQSSGPFTITGKNQVGAFTNILRVINLKIFGGNPSFAIFFFTLIGLIGFIGVLYFWKTVAGRTPD